MAITFETAQQLFYIKRFNLGNEATFFSLLKTQTYRWIIWVILSYFLVWFTKNNIATKKLTLSDFAKYAIAIAGLVFINILLISISQIILNGDKITIPNIVNDYIVFFTFQKAPIYTLGYIAITIILHLYFANEQLQIKIQTLSDLKELNTNLYKKLSASIDDKATILNIKIGNKRKIIPVKDISWIEADDYCVKVHTTKSNTYTMRSSLKALEQKLESNFLRIHRKAIVNMDLVKEINLSQSPVLILENDEKIPISKSNLKIVKDFIS
ncbi:LytTR family DNA-binding domain-containing protein [uncultured Lacinutrix sp.]|uniref:LytR/AlgR family response regulator transcription factor n=1 Tax=uncultured Lacinutrix sp. TaxID=574032 RepID=UPI002608ACFF|nr:LytTR family DNA-binding domain-containing protein [uncultured Lacinutrix sp.]